MTYIRFIFGIWITCVFLGLGVAGCTDATTHNGGGGKRTDNGDSSDSKKETEKTESSSIGDGKKRITVDEEGEEADDPVPVSGAMLTCASVQVPDDDSNQDLYGCVIERDGKAVARNSFKATYDVTTKEGGSVNSANVEQADALSLWNVFIKVPKSKTQEYLVKATVIWTKDGESRPEELTAVLTENGNVHALRFGMDHEFHVGNDDYSGSACKPRIQIVPLFGTSLSLSFTITKDTKTAFHVTGICGVDYRNISVIQILKGTTIIKTVPIPTNDDSLIFGIGILKPGTYTLQLKSGKPDPEGSDYDDFIIGDITVTGDAPISGVLQSSP